MRPFVWYTFSMEGKKILIIEDEKPLAKALSLKLSHAGASATVAGNGDEAIELLGKESFDLILLDIIMPKKDGFETMKEIREKGITTPVIATSNLGQGSDIDKMKELGVVDYFIKSDTSLVDIVSKIEAFFTT